MYFYDYTVPYGWEDDTYGNDTCPSFIKLLEEHDVYLKMYADYPDREDREDPEQPRYNVYLYSVHRNPDPHSELYNEPEPCEPLVADPLIWSDSLNTVMAFLKSEQADFQIDAILNGE